MKFSKVNHSHTFLILNLIIKREVQQHSIFFVRHDYFKNSSFPTVKTEMNKMNCYISNADSLHVF